MAKGERLGEFEIIVIAAVLRLDAAAYGVSVRQEIAKHIGRDTSYGAVYATLDRLERKGFLNSEVGDSTPQRGGRAKRAYSVTRNGRASLRASLDEMGRMIDGLGLGWSRG